MKLTYTKRIKIFAGLILACMTMFVSCGNDDPVRAREAAVKHLFKKHKVKVAVARGFEENQTEMWNGANLAKEQLNADESIPFEIELVQYDDGGSVLSATRKAYEIVSDNEICAVIGHAYSDITLECSIIYQYYGMLLFNCLSTAHKLTERKNPLVVSNVPDDNLYGDAVAQICVQNGYERILVYYVRSSWGSALTSDVEVNCVKNGIVVVATESFEPHSEESEHKRIINRWRNNFTFDAVFLAGRMPDLAVTVKAIRSEGVDCPIIGTDTFDEITFAETLAPRESERIFAVSNNNHENQHPQYQSFINDFVNRYETTPDQEALQAYDALVVLAKAITEAKSAIPAKVVGKIKNQEWNEAAGPYFIDENGKNQKKALTKKVFRKGAFVNY